MSGKHKRYKSVLDELKEMEENRANRTPRGYATKELAKIANQALADVELESLTMFKILKTFERLLSKMEDRKSRVVHQIANFNYTVRGQKEFIFSITPET